jgi:hypothetical protein
VVKTVIKEVPVIKEVIKTVKVPVVKTETKVVHVPAQCRCSTPERGPNIRVTPNFGGGGFGRGGGDNRGRGGVSRGSGQHYR